MNQLNMDQVCEYILNDGTSIGIRPITIDDIDHERSFVQNLSPKTKHERFFSGLSGLSDNQLKYFCDVDFEQHVAFVATIKGNEGESQIGVARYVVDQSGNEAEIAITVADAWQHQGLGSLLMEHLISYARKKGIDLLYSYVLTDNKNMLRLEKKYGFLIQRDQDNTSQLLCTLNLNDEYSQRNQEKIMRSVTS